MLSIPVAIGVTEDTAASNKMTYIRKDADKEMLLRNLNSRSYIEVVLKESRVIKMQYIGTRLQQNRG